MTEMLTHFIANSLSFMKKRKQTAKKFTFKINFTGSRSVSYSEKEMPNAFKIMLPKKALVSAAAMRSKKFALCFILKNKVRSRAMISEGATHVTSFQPSINLTE